MGIVINNYIKKKILEFYENLISVLLLIKINLYKNGLIG